MTKYENILRETKFYLEKLAKNINIKIFFS
jgi:hypothetical protein